MADNSSLPVASGNETFANDDIGGVKYPRPKINWGPDGTANDVDVASGKPLPVQLRSPTGVAPVVTAASTAPVATDTALVVAMSPNTQNANGQTTMANSTPVVLASDQSAVAVTPAGNVAHDAVDSGNPVKQGGKAVAGASGLTLVAAADRTDSYHGIDGIQYVRPHCGLEDIVTGNATNTDGTSTSCIASSGAGVKTYLTSVVLCNTSATAITVDIKDGSTTKVSLPLPAGSGCVFNPPVPVPGTAATAWSFDPSAAATTVTCSMVGFKSKV